MSTKQTTALPFTLGEGKEIIIKGVPTPDADRFTINLCGADYAADTALHLNIRFKQNVFVRNSYHNGWGNEERDGEFPFERDASYVIRIVVRENKFEIYVNGAHFCDFEQRLPIGDVKNVIVADDTTASVSFYQEPVELTGPDYALPSSLTEGKEIIVSGVAAADWKRFRIDLIAGLEDNADVALLYEPRHDQNVVVRTSRLRGGFGIEEREGAVPFQRGEPYEIKFVVWNTHYQVLVNGEFFCNFVHRMPIEVVKNVVLRGDTTETAVKFNTMTNVTRAEVQDPAHALPYVLSSGKEITVKGTPVSNANRFMVSFRENRYDNENTALLFNPRFDLNVVVRNTKSTSWGGEEREGGFPFKRDEPYELKFVISDTDFEISFNGEHFCNYKHRLEMETVKYVLIEGDSNVDEVKFS